MFLEIIALGAILVFLHLRFTKLYKYWEQRGVPYYLRRNPYLDLPNIIKPNITKEAIEMYNAMPDKSAYGIFLLRQPALLIKDPEVIRNIGIKDFDNFTNHQDSFFKNDEMLGKNLFALKDKKWRDMRTVLSPVFTGSKLRGLCSLMSECGEQTVSYYSKQCKVQKNPKAVLKIDFLNACSRFTNDVIASAAFGIKINSLDDSKNEFFEIGQTVTNIPSWRFMLFSLPTFIQKIFKIKFLESRVYEFFRKIVNETIRVRTAQNIIRYDMIHLLMEARKGQIKKNEDPNTVDTLQQNVLTNEDITAQGLIFFVAGFTNVALTISFASYELAVNPETQEKLYAEIQETLKQHNGKIDYDIIKGLKYMDMVMSETMRKWSAAAVTDRVCNKHMTLQTPDGDFELEPGMMLSISITGLHYDPKYFPNPQKFNPERFSEENKSKIQPYTYMPFGLGPRLCIANRFVLLETKVLLFHLIKTFEIVVTEETPIPMVLDASGVMKPKDGKFGLGVKLRA